MNYRMLIALTATMAVLVNLDSASAQYFTGGANAQNATRNYILNRPTVSPYLNLIRQQSDFSLPNYHTLVRPQLEARDRQTRQETALRQLQSRVSNSQGRRALRRPGEQGFSTGHPTRFMMYLHYYPSLNRRR